MFAQKSCFCGSRGISFSTGRNADRGKAVYIWISVDPAKAGPTLGGGGVVVVFCFLLNGYRYTNVVVRKKQTTQIIF